MVVRKGLIKIAQRIDPSKVSVASLGGGAVAAKNTANVWEIVQLSNLVTPLLYNGV